MLNFLRCHSPPLYQAFENGRRWSPYISPNAIQHWNLNPDDAKLSSVVQQFASSILVHTHLRAFVRNRVLFQFLKSNFLVNVPVCFLRASHHKLMCMYASAEGASKKILSDTQRFTKFEISGGAIRPPQTKEGVVRPPSRVGWGSARCLHSKTIFKGTDLLGKWGTQNGKHSIYPVRSLWTWMYCSSNSDRSPRKYGETGRSRQVDSTAKLTEICVTAQKSFSHHILSPWGYRFQLNPQCLVCGKRGEKCTVNLIYRENWSRYPDILIREAWIHFLLKIPQSDQQSSFAIKP